MGRKKKYPERDKYLKQISQLRGEELERFKQEQFFIPRSDRSDKFLLGVMRTGLANQIRWNNLTLGEKKQQLQKMHSVISSKPKYSNEEIINIGKKYTSPNEWKQNDKNSYNIMCRRKLNLRACGHMLNYIPPKKDHTLLNCQQQAIKFKTRRAWAIGDSPSYQYAYRKKWLQICYELMPNKGLAHSTKQKCNFCGKEIAVTRYKIHKQTCKQNPKNKNK